ncbi:hypothetical protein [uncultured Algimonas sp.]|uniref:hypothetical protein n=1 Tax=uncultured Algimonas sp. TaxID=1547920 RepID=UPI0026025FFC|nr:hypothetical protein [uncultured Algimonas sp.]
MKQLLLALAATLLALPALAADPFTVAKVPVDATADTAIQAQTNAVQSGYIKAARELLNRLTLESEREARGLPPLTLATVGPLIRGQTIDNERRSATRYLGDVSIAFNPAAVQRLLRDQGLTMVRSQARERLFVPVGFDPDSDTARDLVSGRYAHALTPVKSIDADELRRLTDEPSEIQLQSLADRYGVERLLIVRPSSGGIDVTELVMETGERRSLSARSPAALVARLEADWKANSAVPSGSAQSAPVSVLYDSISEWQRLQRAINNSVQISDARLDAVSKDGALMTLRFGSVERLADEMAQKGLRVYEDPQMGLVIRR